MQVLGGAKSAFEIALGKLGVDHPYTETVRNDLAALERKMKGEG